MADLKRLYREHGGQTIFLMGIRGVSLVSKFILTLFIARFMGFEDLGLYGLIVAATFLIPSFVGLGIMYMKSRNAVTQTQQEIVLMLYCYGRFIVFVYAILFVIAALSGYSSGHLLLALMILFVVLFEHINNDLYSLLLNLSKPLSANILHFIRTSVWIFVFMIVAFLMPSLQTMEILLAGWGMGSFLAFLGFLWVVRGWSWKITTSLPSVFCWVREEFKSSRTIYLNNIMDSSSHYINNFLVTFFLGLELTGVYVYFMQIINALSNLLRTGVIQVARPKLVLAHKTSEGSFVELYKECMKHTMLASITMAVISVPAMYFVTAYIVDKPLALEWFPIIGVNLAFFIILMAMEVGQLVLYSHHRDDLTLKLSFLNIMGLIILNVILIPFASLWGAVIALLVMMIIKLRAQRHFIKKLVKGL